MLTGSDEKEAASTGDAYVTGRAGNNPHKH